ncbi:hypothetical protein K474DRAFT_591797 [Panus rudis PR-1116 ss-1]|nr:hypothetical protein K474DRAFT_591797 [Panus rudis PR-1116 ss-1]
MVFNSGICVDQLRVQENISHSTLNPHRDSRDDLSISPTILHSECSTLVDFAVDPFPTEEYSLGSAEEDYVDNNSRLLTNDNSAWLRKKAQAGISISKHRRSRRRQTAKVDNAEMIDVDDRAWAMPTNEPAKFNSPRKVLSGLMSRKQKAQQSPCGLKPELIDLEDRAWM